MSNTCSQVSPAPRSALPILAPQQPRSPCRPRRGDRPCSQRPCSSHGPDPARDAARGRDAYGESGRRTSVDSSVGGCCRDLRVASSRREAPYRDRRRVPPPMAGDPATAAGCVRHSFSLVTTPRAKGLVSELHPRSLRHGGLAAFPYWARHYTSAGVDAALVLGTDLDDCSIGPTPYIAPHGKLVHVDTDSNVFHRNPCRPTSASWPRSVNSLRPCAIS